MRGKKNHHQIPSENFYPRRMLGGKATSLRYDVVEPHSDAVEVFSKTKWTGETESGNKRKMKKNQFRIHTISDH